VAIVPFQAFARFADSILVEALLQCTQNPMHLVESAAPSGSSRLHSSMNFASRN